MKAHVLIRAKRGHRVRVIRVRRVIDYRADALGNAWCRFVDAAGTRRSVSTDRIYLEAGDHTA